LIDPRTARCTSREHDGSSHPLTHYSPPIKRFRSRERLLAGTRYRRRVDLAREWRVSDDEALASRRACTLAVVSRLLSRRASRSTNLSADPNALDVAVSTNNPLASSLTARRLINPLVLEWRRRATSRRSAWIDVATVHLTFEQRDPRLPARARRKCAPRVPVQGRLAGPARTRPRAFRSRGRTAPRRPSSHKPVDALWTTRDGATLVGRRKGGAVDRQRGDARDVAAKLARRTTTTEWKAPQVVAQRATPEPPLPSAERATVDSAGYTSGLDAARPRHGLLRFRIPEA
jgi:hypothetical protein